MRALKHGRGKKNPVTLVATVVVRKSAVQRGNNFAASNPESQTESRGDSHRLMEHGNELK